MKKAESENCKIQVTHSSKNAIKIQNLFLLGFGKASGIGKSVGTVVVTAAGDCRTENGYPVKPSKTQMLLRTIRPVIRITL